MIYTVLKFVLGLRGTAKGTQEYVQASNAQQAAAKAQDGQHSHVVAKLAKNQDSTTYKKLKQ